MSSDSIPNASFIPFASSNHKDFAKKKRSNRTAKLKQCKLDVRREQWLSQVKNKGIKEECNGGGGTCGERTHVGRENSRLIGKLGTKREEENEVLMNNYSDSESPANSPASHTSSGLGSNGSRMSFTATGSSSSSSSGGSCSGCVSEEDEEGDDGCLDDWEVVADALAANDGEQEKHRPGSDFSLGSNENCPRMDSQPESNIRIASGIGSLKHKKETEVTSWRAPSQNCRAWRPDDTYRPQSLPSLSKQFSFPMIRGQHCGRGGGGWVCTVVPSPTLCPICCEDLDFTDTRFLPCSCGFRLCLFCHKRILEEDGRCPGCRKHYNSNEETL